MNKITFLLNVFQIKFETVIVIVYKSPTHWISFSFQNKGFENIFPLNSLYVKLFQIEFIFGSLHFSAGFATMSCAVHFFEFYVQYLCSFMTKSSDIIQTFRPIVWFECITHMICEKSHKEFNFQINSNKNWYKISNLVLQYRMNDTIACIEGFDVVFIADAYSNYSYTWLLGYTYSAWYFSCKKSF